MGRVISLMTARPLEYRNRLCRIVRDGPSEIDFPSLAFSRLLSQRGLCERHCGRKLYSITVVRCTEMRILYALESLVEAY